MTAGFTASAGTSQPVLLRLGRSRERLGEVLGFLAIPAKAREIGELFARLREVAGLDIPLAEVFVRAEVGRIVGQRLVVEARLDQRMRALVGLVAVEVREIGTHCGGDCARETEHDSGEGGAAEHWGVPDDYGASLSGSSEPASARRCYLLRNGSKE